MVYSELVSTVQDRPLDSLKQRICTTTITKIGWDSNSVPIRYAPHPSQLSIGGRRVAVWYCYTTSRGW